MHFIYKYHLILKKEKKEEKYYIWSFESTNKWPLKESPEENIDFSLPEYIAIVSFKKELLTLYSPLPQLNDLISFEASVYFSFRDDWLVKGLLNHIYQSIFCKQSLVVVVGFLSNHGLLHL